MRAQVELALNANPFSKGISSAVGAIGRLEGAAQRVGRFVTGAFATMGASLSAGAFVNGVKNVLELGDTLDELHQQTGISVKDLVLLRQGFDESGVGAENVASIIGKMQKAIVAGSKEFANLGLKTKELIKEGPAAQFEKIGKAIASIENPAKRAAAAIAIFGKTGANLVPLFKSGLGGSQQIDQQAAALAKNAAAFGQVADKMKVIKLGMENFFIGVVEKALPAITAVLDRFDKTDWGKKGGDFAKAFGETMEKDVTPFIESTKKEFEFIKNLPSKIRPFIDKHFPEVGGLLPTNSDAFLGSLVGAGVVAAVPRPAPPISTNIPRDFWRSPDPRTNLFKGDRDPFMSKTESMSAQRAEFVRRFGENAFEPDFVNKFAQGSTEGLERWSERVSGIKRGAYNQIRRGDAERAKQAMQPEEKKTEATISKESMDSFADTVANKLDKKIP